jgi:hypothetical protein
MTEGYGRIADILYDLKVRCSDFELILELRQACHHVNVVHKMNNDENPNNWRPGINVASYVCSGVQVQVCLELHRTDV